MSEQAAWADLSSVAMIVPSISWSNTAYIYLELVPKTLLDEQTRQGGIRIDHFDRATPFDTWQRGRIFDTHHELKWEQRNGSFHTVYYGQQMPSGFHPIELKAVREQLQRYYLWGERVSEEDRKTLGLSSNAQAFLELQIPRILHYPVAATDHKRVCIIAHELYTADGSLCYSRWCGLEMEGKA